MATPPKSAAARAEAAPRPGGRSARGIRALLAAVLGLGLGAGGCRPSAPRSPWADPFSGQLDPAQWRSFKQAFVTPEGRVVDAANGGVSHSEGQGYGLLLAEAFADRPCFAQLWDWTRRRLQVRGTDPLLAWRWRPAAGESRAGAAEGAGDSAGGVDDPNNASDGDLLVAWALARAGRRWSEPAYTEAARVLARAVRGQLVRPLGPRLVLLPGVAGFERRGGTVVNLSYWVFPAFDELDRIDPDPAWSQLAASGLELIGRARFGPRQLPPDWLLLPPDPAAPPRPDPANPPVFGYNAVRIPLYLLWGRRAEPRLLDPFGAWWASAPTLAGVPATVDLETNQPGPDPTLPGISPLAQWLARRAGSPGRPGPENPFRPENGYYSCALFLLTRVGIVETQ